MRRWLGVLALCLGGLTCAQAQGTAQSPVKFGLIGPMTGGSADFGEAMRRGVELAVSEINSVGGYLGRPLEAVVRDDRGDPGIGKRVVQELLAEHPDMVAAIGICNTGVAVAAIPHFQQAHVPLIVPCTTGSPVTKQFSTPESYVFRVSPSDEISAPFIVSETLKRGWSRVAIFADDTVYGQSGTADVVRALNRAGIKPVYVTSFPLGTTSLLPAMEAARAAGANVILAYTVGPENAVIAKSRAAAKWKVPLIGPWSLSFPTFIQGAGAEADGTLMVQTFIAEPSNERRASFLSAYSRKFGTARLPVPMAAAQAYDATYLLAYAIFGIKSRMLDGASMKASLENLSRVYYGVVVTYDRPFSAQSKEAITTNMLVLGQVKKGVVTFANPEDARRNLFVQRKTQ